MMKPRTIASTRFEQKTMNPPTRWLPAGFLEPGTNGSVKTVIRPVGSRPVEVSSSVEVPK